MARRTARVSFHQRWLLRMLATVRLRGEPPRFQENAIVRRSTAGAPPWAGLRWYDSLEFPIRPATVTALEAMGLIEREPGSGESEVFRLTEEGRRAASEGG